MKKVADHWIKKNKVDKYSSEDVLSLKNFLKALSYILPRHLEILCHNSSIYSNIKQVKSMQRSANEAIRTQLQPSKPKREITYYK